MSDPWSFLDLDPAKATEKDVRSAYARLLKKYRPDQDPAGFQRLREAYAAALEMVRNRTGSEEYEERVLVEIPSSGPPLDEQAEPQTEEDSEDSPISPGVSYENFPWRGLPDTEQGKWPEEVREALDALSQAVATGSLKRARKAFRKSWLVFQDAGVPVEDRAQAWQHITWNAPSKLAPMVAVGALVEQWKGGEWDLTRSLLGNDAESFGISDIKRFARCLAKEKAAITHLEAAQVALQLADMVAIDLPKTARVLMDAAYPQIPAHERKAALAHCEARERTAALVALIPWWRQRFWRSVFRDEGVPVNWKKWRNRYRLKKLTHWMPGTWGGWPLVAQFVPDELWQRTLKYLKREDWWRRRMKAIQLLRPRHLANLCLVILGAMVISLVMALFVIHPDPIINVEIHHHRRFPPFPPATPPKTAPVQNAPSSNP